MPEKLKGIIPALESSHALAEARKRAKDVGKRGSIVVCLSGRGDKDLESVLEYDAAHAQTDGGQR